MTKKIRKALLLVACFALTIALSIGGTIAWLQNETNEVTNTFSVGDVGFDESLRGGLDEADVDEYGDIITDEEGNPVDRVTANDYKLVPGENYTKDPTIHLAEDNEPAYVFVEVKNPIADIEAATTIYDQMEAKGWINLAEAWGEEYKDIWVYQDIVHTLLDATKIEAAFEDVAVAVPETAEGNYDMVVFEEFTLQSGDDLDLTDYDGKQIKVKAFIIQAKGFYKDTEAGAEEDHLAGAEAAWEAADFDLIVVADDTTGDDTTGA